MATGEQPGEDRVGAPDASETTQVPGHPSARESVKVRVAHLRERAEHTRAGIEARRADSASIATAFEVVERDAQSGGGVLAAAVAFRLFMFLVPYAFVMVTGFGLASTAAGQDPSDAARSAGIGGLLASAVASTSTLSLVNRIVALALGGFALALTARSLVSVLWIVHRLIWRAQPHGKPSPWAPLILVGFITFLFGMADLAAWIGSQSLSLRVVAFFITVVVSAGAWFLASWLLPRDDCALWALLPGALIVGVGVGVLQILTITYVVHVVTRKSALYGAIGIALALLLWTYFAGRLLTAAIAANASIWKHKTGEAMTQPDLFPTTTPTPTSSPANPPAGPSGADGSVSEG
ncbi:MAG TPA: YhjD/YihY/BrkB family envelope integrity protein [Acidimicrobiales bacterium]|nr:YhjD/YihY/BrkB family envelope integrity protein [Acidimicrobiales bacterium]